MAVAPQPDEEAQTPRQQRLVELHPLPAPVQHIDAAPVGGPGHRLDDGQPLGVLALKVRRRRRPEFLHQRHAPPSLRLARQGDARPIAVDRFPRAPVPHPPQMRHRLGIGFTPVGRVHHAERVGLHARGRGRDKVPLHRPSQSRRGQMAREPFRGLLEQDRFAQRPPHLAEFAILAGGQPEQHLLQKFGFGLGKMGRDYPPKPDESGRAIAPPLG